MQYRTIPATGDRVSAIGLGCEHVGPKDESTVRAVVNAALEQGINLFELFMPQPEIRDKIGSVIANERKNLYLMGHIGSTLTDDGQYYRCREVGRCERFIEDFLRRYHTDYIDYGMLHYVDTDEDFRGTFETDCIEYALRLKKEGKVRLLGASSHVASTALRMVETGLIDVLLFSINLAQDILPEDIGNEAYFIDSTYENLTERRLDPVRQQLYAACAERGVAITVMKSLGCGRLLTPLNGLPRPMTPHQCIHYAMTRPAVSSVFVGCTEVDHVAQAVSYFDAAPESLDFSDLMEGMHNPLQGKCMYCNHCLPCPVGIDIAEAMRAIDSGDPNAVAALSAGPADCIGCGSCEPNCPFGLPISTIFANNR